MNPPLLPPLTLEDGVFVLDNSTMERYVTCARSFEYYGIRKRETRGRRHPLNFGSAVHDALEYYYRNPKAPYLEIVDAGIEHIDPDLLEDYRNRDLFMATISAYTSEYIVEPFEVVTTKSGEPFIEQGFLLPLGEVHHPDGSVIPCAFKGKLDLLVRWDDGQLVVLDHKTTSMLGDRFFKEYEMADQPIGYVWAAEQLFGEPISTYCINAISARPPTKTKPENITFARQRYPINSDRVSEWRDNTLQLMQRIVIDHARNYFPLERKWCVGKYGPCPYFEVCSLPQTGRLDYLGSNDFQDVTWDPLTA